MGPWLIHIVHLPVTDGQSMLRLHGRSINANKRSSEDDIHESILAKAGSASRVRHAKTARRYDS